MENFNSNLKFIRCSLPLIPLKQNFLDISALTIGFNIEPFSILNDFEVAPLKIKINDVDYNIEFDSVPKCPTCETRLNKYFKVTHEINISSNKNTNGLGLSYYSILCNLCDTKFKTDRVKNDPDQKNENINQSYLLLSYLNNLEKEYISNENANKTQKSDIEKTSYSLMNYKKANYNIDYKSVLIDYSNCFQNLISFPTIDFYFIDKKNKIRFYNIFLLDMSLYSSTSGFLSYVS